MYAPTEGLIEGPVGAAELLAEVDVEVNDVLGGLLVEELDVVGATEELCDVLVGTVDVEELMDEVDLTDELEELVDFVVEDEVDLTELDEDEEDLTDEVDADVEVDLIDELRVDEEEVDFTDELDEVVVRTTEVELVELADELAVVVVVQGGRLTRDL